MHSPREPQHRVVCTIAALSMCWGLTSAPVDGGETLRRTVSFPGRAAVRFYQLFISGQDLPSCNFSPSCSAFSLEAFEAGDPFQAALMTFDRVQRCHYWIPGEYPFHQGRFVDPVDRHLLWGNTASSSPASAAQAGVVSAAAVPLPPVLLLHAAEAMIAAGDIDAGLHEYRALLSSSAPPAVRHDAGLRAVWILIDRQAYAAAALLAEQLAAEQDHDDALLLAALARALDPGAAMHPAADMPLAQYIAAWGELVRGRTSPVQEQLAALASSSDPAVALASRQLLTGLAPLDLLGQRRGWIAGGLSTAVPGLGRVYTGRYGDAAFSFILTGGGAGLAVRAIAARGRIEAAIFSGLAAGLYLGSIHGSIVSARTENDRHRMAIVQRALGDAEARGHHPRILLKDRLAARLSLRPPPAAVIDAFAAPLARHTADELFGRHAWDEAARWYRLHQQLAPREALTDTLLFRYAAALDRAGAGDDDIGAAYEALLDGYPDSPLAGAARIALARTWLNRGHPALARLELEDQRASSGDSSLLAQADYLVAWTFVHDYRWSSAADWLEAHPAGAASPFGEASAAISRRLAQPRSRKSPRLARLLSAVVPGLGQLYAGQPLDAAGALMINSAAGYALARSLRSQNWLDAGLVGVLLFNRFYTGNLYHAARFSRAYNQRQDRALLDDLRTAAGPYDPYRSPAEAAESFPLPTP